MLENRKKFINHLRTNPDNRHRIDCALTDGGNGRCALGLGLEGLGVDLHDGFDSKPYREATILLGFNIDGRNNENLDIIWRLSDRGHTFAEVANVLEKLWEESKEDSSEPENQGSVG